MIFLNQLNIFIVVWSYIKKRTKIFTTINIMYGGYLFMKCTVYQ